MKGTVLTVYQDLGSRGCRAAQFPLDHENCFPSISVDGDPCVLLTREDLHGLHTVLDQVAGGHTEDDLAGRNGNSAAGNGPRVSEVRRVLRWRDRLATILEKPHNKVGS